MHAHLAPTNATFSHPINLYDRRVTNIHNPGMNGSSYLSEKDKKGTKHENIWTNSLFLYPDKVVVKTFDHEKGRMDGSLDARGPAAEDPVRVCIMAKLRFQESGAPGFRQGRIT